MSTCRPTRIVTAAEDLGRAVSTRLISSYRTGKGFQLDIAFARSTLGLLPYLDFNLRMVRKLEGKRADTGLLHELSCHELSCNASYWNLM
ncbi:Hypothetical protein NTJ_07843 [Nesidiocoris tenuis]|uniref:Uncharacterized protein n=1 Tax=Nesidiocoris tenuis TaxID=355587 RepID=A0ABN7AS54_9HEMI|nr:Hypothetical protein NTJ_07843 [Nesidiocoris tenuis]